MCGAVVVGACRGTIGPPGATEPPGPFISPIIEELWSMPSSWPRCQPYWLPDDQPKKNPEKKITARDSTAPVKRPTHAAARNKQPGSS